MTQLTPITGNIKPILMQNIVLNQNIHLLENNIDHHSESLIAFVDDVIKHAIQQSASDIHIEPYSNIYRIRYRCHGLLYEIANIPTELAARLITRLKVLAKLDICERRLPQDGHFQLYTIDIRINTCPTSFGEKIVLRLLDAKKVSLRLSELGFNLEQKNLLIAKISEPSGLILATGPTGSGKTVTLYSVLHYLNSSEKNLATVEDPIEIQLPGINQVNINHKIGLNFPTVLRTLLRQDPDIIMVGEIRDRETAEIAIQAAQTGHLVLSTLHTNTATEAISRLIAMGVAKEHILSSLSLVIAQRLIRKLCFHCKQLETVSSTLLSLEKKYEHISIHKANGCNKCLNGYDGRIGIYEFLSFTQTNDSLLENKILPKAYFSLFESGMEKIALGITSIAELRRVLGVKYEMV